jgi:hypothetical protein
MFKKLSVDAVLGVFQQTITDLREVEKNNLKLGEEAAERIKVNLVLRDDALKEAERAASVAGKISAIFNPSDVL